jgi:hypothetical protein
MNPLGWALSEALENMEFVMISLGYTSKYISGIEKSLTTAIDLGQKREYNVEFKNLQDTENIECNSVWSLMYKEETQEFRIWNFVDNSFTVSIHSEKDLNKVMWKHVSRSNGMFNFKFVSDDNLFLIPETINETVFMIWTPLTLNGKSTYFKLNDFLSQSSIISEAKSHNSLLTVDNWHGSDNPYLFSLESLKFEQKTELIFVNQIAYYVMAMLYILESKSEDPGMRLFKNRHEIAKAINMIYLFLTNELPGKIKPGYPKGKVIVYRQDMLGNSNVLNILTQFIGSLMSITENFSENDERKHMKFDPDLFTAFDNLYDVLFNTLSSSCIDNQQNIDVLTQNIALFSKAINYQSCMELIVNLLKRNIIDLNKDEIHNSILNCTRIYYSNDVFKALISSLIEEYSSNYTESAFIVLRKLCVSNENPFYIHQIMICKQLLKKMHEQGHYMHVNFRAQNKRLLIKVKDRKGREVEHFAEEFDKFTREQRELVFNVFKINVSLWYGRNKYTRDKLLYSLYRSVYLVDILLNPDVNSELRAKIMKLYVWFFVDFAPHHMSPSESAYVVSQSNEKYLETRRPDINKEIEEDFPKLFKFLTKHMTEWIEIRDDHILKPFEIEIIKLCHYLLRFNLFTHTDYEQFIALLFEYLIVVLKTIIYYNFEDLYTDVIHNIDKSEINEGFPRDLPAQRALFSMNYSFISSLNRHKDIRDITNFEWEGFKFTQELVDGFIKHILSIFHYLADLRKIYFTTNLVEMFHLQAYWKIDQRDNVEFNNLYELINLVNLEKYKDCVPDSENFQNLLEYEFPSLQNLYEIYWSKYVKSTKKNLMTPDDRIYWLLIQMFNIWGDNFHNKQLCITLIARVNNEIGEFARSIDRTLLMFNKQEELLYNLIFEWSKEFERNAKRLDKYVDGQIWNSDSMEILVEEYDQANHPADNIKKALSEINKPLVTIFFSLTRKWTISEDSNGNLTLNRTSEEKLNTFAQIVCRNLKVYDMLIQFVTKNKHYLQSDYSDDSIEGINYFVENCYDEVKDTFKIVFEVLKQMTKRNEKTQRVMWKYKELFVLEELGSQPQIGELDLLLKIMESKEMITKTRDFTDLVDSLHKRISEVNLKPMFGIFNKLAIVTDSPFIKKAALEFIEKNSSGIFAFDNSFSQKERLHFHKAVQGMLSEKEFQSMRKILASKIPRNSVESFLKCAYKETSSYIQDLKLVSSESIDNPWSLDDLKFKDPIKKAILVDVDINILIEIYLQVHFHEEFTKDLDFDAWVNFHNEFLKTYQETIERYIRGDLEVDSSK